MQAHKSATVAIAFSIVLASMRWPTLTHAATLPSLTPSTNTPAVEGTLNALAAGADGSLYIGGNFTKVGGLARKNLARLTPSGQVDASWQCDANNIVMALTAVGNEVYVAGQFSQIGGQSRAYLASVSGGSVTSWNPAPNGMVNALSSSADAVYAAGYFTSIAGSSKVHLAAFDSHTHALKPFNANLLTTETLSGVSLIGTKLYLGGTFSSIAGQARRYAASVDAETGSLTPWHPIGVVFVSQFFKVGSNIIGTGNAMEGIDETTGAILWTFVKGGGYAAAKDDILYFGSQTAGAVDSAGKIQPWLGGSSGGNSTIKAVAIAGSSLYFGGDFTSFSGQSSINLARFDFGGPPRDSRLPPVLPSPAGVSPNDNIYTAVGAPDGSLYIGGNFTQINGVSRNYLAKLKPDGSLDTSWNPNPDQAIYKLVLYGSTLYVDGGFSRIGGRNQRLLAALDATTGNALAWAPVIADRPISLAVDASNVYVCGLFETVNGQSRHHLAAFDRQTGAVTSWAPTPAGTSFGGYVIDLAVSDSAVYASGIFDHMSGRAGLHVAAVDKVTGAATSFSSPLGGGEYAAQMALNGNDLYVAANSTLYALNATTGAVRWKTAGRYSLVSFWNGVVYAGGLSGSTNYQAQAYDAATGDPLGWNALLTPISSNGAPLSVIAPTQTALYLAGNPGTTNGLSTPYIARFPWDGQVTPPPPPPPDLAPSITTQPQSRTVTAGQKATFSITARGTAPLTYQWQKAISGSSTFNAVAGATSWSYITPATVLGDSGSQYRCLVTNSTGTATSNAATLTVNADLVSPTIIAQPTNQRVTAGQMATFSVAASGTAPLAYQWQKAISGSSTFNTIADATLGSYTTAVTIVDDSGSQYRCVVTNSTGTATSNSATLTVNAAPIAPTITAHPTNQTVTAGQTATFNVVASGTAPLSYQWQKAISGSITFNAIARATLPSYTTAATVLGASGSQYRCVVTNSTGTATSNSATLTVNAAPIAPTITAHPTNQTVTAGQTATFDVVASGTAPLSYQWQEAISGSSTFNPVAGATSSSYTTAATVLGDSGSQFRCVVTNSTGTGTSNSATLTVNAVPVAPTILAQPSNQTVTAGQTATFSVTASGTMPLTYQWQKAISGSPTFNSISGATSANYTSEATVVGDSGLQYRCVVTNSTGTATSNSATLTVNAAPIAPTITAHPTNQTVTAGQTATFNVVASGTAPLSYQWQKAISGSITFNAIARATSPSYTTAATVLGASGSQYRCVVTNSTGTATSNPATLTVNAAPIAPTITAHPTNQTVTVGQTATFSVTASGTAPLAYQWQKAISGSSTFNTIAGATLGSYTTAVTIVDDGGSQYRCVVTNSTGTATSNPASLMVNAAPVAPTILAHPVNQTVTAGQIATFSITASGTASLTYQWQKAISGSITFNAIAGATSPSYTTAATVLGDSGSQYRCVVTNSTGTATSNPATLSVNAASVAPSITAQPTNQTVTAGQTATFSVTATGTAPLIYQWQKAISGSSTFNTIAGATLGSYTTAVTIVDDGGSQYRCVVTNSTGTATSNSATLTVNAAPVAPTILAQPSNQTATAGQTATFGIMVSGTAPLTYQWQKAIPGSSTFNAVAGATSSSYTTAATVLGDSGSQFRCVVTNSTGTGTSNSATLTVNAAPVAPTILTHPVNQTVTAGQIATFSITASGTGPLTYQWQKAIPGSITFNAIARATSPSYTTAATVLGASGSQYRCVVMNSTGTATSNPATLIVNAVLVVPTITAQPTNQRVTAGQTATFGITASGTAPLTYQWQKAISGSPTFNSISGATSANYTSEATVVGDSGLQYRCVVTNSTGTATSNSATLTVNAAPIAPTITAHPTNQTVTAGQTATFNVVASGTALLSYQWQKAISGTSVFNPMSGATSASYTTAATVVGDGGAQYRCVVRNSTGTATSNPATLTVSAVLVAPTITAQPTNQAVTAGQTATFSIAVSGTAPLAYQWQKAISGSAFFDPITGATSASYTTAVTVDGDSGSQLRCVVTNSTGTATSNAATLTVQSPPKITVQPTNTSVIAGQKATFSITAGGTTPLTYQWQKNAVAIAGATSNQYITPVTVLGDDAAVFRCVVHNSYGDLLSDAATLTVTAAGVAPSIANQPVSQSVVEGEDAVFTVSAAGTEPLAFQWQKNGVVIAGATSTTYKVTGNAVTQGTIYRCVVSNAFGTLTSGNASLTVDVAPEAPRELQALAGDESVTLVWRENSEADVVGYNIYRARGAGGVFGLQTTHPLDQTNFVQTTLINGQLYLYKIAAIDRGGNESPLSAPVSATPIDGAMVAPTLAQPEFESFPTRLHLSDVLRIRTIYNVPVSFAWVFTPESGSPAAPRNATRSSGIGSVTAVPFFSPTAANLTAGSYLVSVTAVSGSQRSQAMEGRIDLVPDETRVNVFPNPWRADRTPNKDITFEGMSLDSTVKIFTVAGRPVRTLEAPNGEVHWDRKNSSGDWAASGIYIYVISNESGQKKRGKLAIVR